MAYSLNLKKLMICVITVMAIVLSFIGVSQARLLAQKEDQGLELYENPTAMKVREFLAMLPKGDPVPPSGPSPGIN